MSILKSKTSFAYDSTSKDQNEFLRNFNKRGFFRCHANNKMAQKSGNQKKPQLLRVAERGDWLTDRTTNRLTTGYHSV